MVKIAGFDSDDLRGSAFSPASLLQSGYHLRAARACVFPMTILLSLGSLVLSCYCLAQYGMLRNNIQGSYANTNLHIGDLMSAEASMAAFQLIAFGFFCVEFFLMAAFPDHIYTKMGRKVKLAIPACLLLAIFGSGVANTLIVAKKSAVLTGPTIQILDTAVRQFSVPPLLYNWFTPNLINVALAWVSWLFIATSLILIAYSNSHDSAFGPQKSLADEGGRRSSMKEDRPVGLKRLSPVYSKDGFVQQDF